MLTATGERDMEQLGGLIHRMPQTAVAFLVGCAAISALPPLNGFVSEWLTFQAILVSPGLPQWGLKLMVPGRRRAAGAGRGACRGLLRQGLRHRLPRPPAQPTAARRRTEADRFRSPPWSILAVLCLLAGMLPGLLIDALAPVTSACSAARMPAQLAMPWLSIVPVADSRSSYNGLIILLFTARRPAR